MQFGEQEALLEMWMDFLAGRHPSAALMRDFYFEVVSQSRFYRYGMAPEVFDLLVNGAFEVRNSALWATSYQTARDIGATRGHRAA